MAAGVAPAAPGADPPAPGWRWLVTDLDGTLVDRSLALVPRSVRALRDFRRRGGKVIIATGRNEESAGRYHRELGLDTPMILYNGARVVAADGTPLLDRALGTDWTRLCDRVLPVLPAGVGVVAFAAGHAYRVRDAPALAEYARRDGIGLLPPPAGLGAAPVPVTKAMLIGDNPGLPGLAGLVHRACPRATVVRSEDTYLEVLPSGATKGQALRWLADRCGVDLATVAAIGDNPNDLDMLRVAGLGAAVGDGHPSVRAVADLVTVGCGQGAVAELVTRLSAAVPARPGRLRPEPDPARPDDVTPEPR